MVRLTPGDSVPVARVWVVLHALTSTSEGPIDSVRTDAVGRYALRLAQRDTAATYLVSAQYDGIAYFAAAFQATESRLQLPPLSVYDTSSVVPSISLAERHVVVRPPRSDGSRSVIELLVLENDGNHTRVAAPDRPVWEGRIPPVAVQADVGPSDFSPDAVSISDSGIVTLTGPVPPGQRQLLIGYVLPRTVRRVDFAPPDSTTALNILLGDSAAAIADSALPFAGVEDLDSDFYRRYGTTGVVRPVIVTFAQASRRRAYVLIPVVVAVGVVVLVSVLWWWWRRRGAAPASPPSTADGLAVRIAELDRAFSGRETDEYRRERAALKAELVKTLARERGQR